MVSYNCIRHLMVCLAFSFPSFSFSQNLFVTDNDSLTLSGSAFLVIYNPSSSKTTTFNNNKVVNCKDVSTVKLISMGPAFIGGSSSPTFKNLSIDLFNGVPDNILTLKVDMTVNGDLTFASRGLLELNSKTISLGIANGQIVGETNTARITGINGGTVNKKMDLTAPKALTNVTFGNIGLVLSTVKDLGNVTVTRGHVQQQNSTLSGVGGIYRYFDIKPTLNPAGNNITAKFNYFDAEVVAPTFTNKKNEFTLWNSPDLGQNWLLNGDDAHDITNDWVLKSGVPTMFVTGPPQKPYRITLGSTVTNPLPVKLLDFYGLKENGQSLLSWKITNEGNASYFELERSAEGKNFSWLANIPAKDLVAKEQHYDFIDLHPFYPSSFYRLKLVDKEQKFTYSNVVKLNSTADASAWIIYPNPAGQIIHISFSSSMDGNTTFQLFNSSGQMVYNKNVNYSKGENKVDLNIKDLPEGVYIIRSSDLKWNNLSFIKN